MTCVIIGLGQERTKKAILDGENRYEVPHINPYLMASRMDDLARLLGDVERGDWPYLDLITLIVPH